MFFKISVLKNFEIFSGKHLCWSAFFNKVTDLKYVTLLKKKCQHGFFPVNIAKFLRAAFYLKHLWWLVLKITSVMKWIKPLNASVALIKKPVNWFTSSCPKTCTSYPIWKVTKLCFSGAYCVFENSVCVWCVCVCVCVGVCVGGWVWVGVCVWVGARTHFHSTWRLHLSGTVGNVREQINDVVLKILLSLPSPFIATFKWSTESF